MADQCDDAARTEHRKILDQIRDAHASLKQVAGLRPLSHDLHFPGQPLLGVYQPDFIWYLDAPDRRICLIGEVEASDFCGKDIPGACLLADHLMDRVPHVESPVLAFVLPDGIATNDRSHVEERLNIAASRAKTLTILEARRASDFIAWFRPWMVDQLNRCADDEDDESEDEDAGAF